MIDDAAARREPALPDDADTAEPGISALDDERAAAAASERVEPVRGEDAGTVDAPSDADTARWPAGPGDPAGPAGPGEPGEPGEPAKQKASRWWEFPVLAAVAILVAILVKMFLIQPFYIPSDSMERTLHGCAGCNGDKILVNKVVYQSRDPHPGEIVVFRAPTGWEEPIVKPRTNAITGAVRWFGQLVGVVPPDEKDLVKRVIATGGQTVRCCDGQGRVQISDLEPNGPFRSLNETYVYLDNSDSSAKFGPVTVPKGRLWVMGDHRNDSADSRYHCGAPLTSCDPVSSTVPVSSVIGKAFVVAWPYPRWRTLGTPSTFTARASAVAGSSLPLIAGGAVVLPFWLWGRRRRTSSRS